MGLIDRYVLDEHKAYPEPNLMKWARWFETADRRVARTELLDGSAVSTVFLGLDHQWGDGPPLLFESALLVHEDAKATAASEWCEIRRRYSTWAEAEVGHMELCEELAHVLPEWKAKATP
jgi:hypothetical protein